MAVHNITASNATQAMRRRRRYLRMRRSLYTQIRRPMS
jgi:hypothetical protein